MRILWCGCVCVEIEQSRLYTVYVFSLVVKPWKRIRRSPHRILSLCLRSLRCGVGFFFSQSLCIRIWYIHKHIHTRTYAHRSKWCTLIKELHERTYKHTNFSRACGNQTACVWMKFVCVWYVYACSMCMCAESVNGKNQCLARAPCSTKKRDDFVGLYFLAFLRRCKYWYLHITHTLAHSCTQTHTHSDTSDIIVHTASVERNPRRNGPSKKYLDPKSYATTAPRFVWFLGWVSA